MTKDWFHSEDLLSHSSWNSWITVEFGEACSFLPKHTKMLFLPNFSLFLSIRWFSAQQRLKSSCLLLLSPNSSDSNLLLSNLGLIIILTLTLVHFLHLHLRCRDLEMRLWRNNVYRGKRCEPREVFQINFTFTENHSGRLFLSPGLASVANSKGIYFYIFIYSFARLFCPKWRTTCWTEYYLYWSSCWNSAGLASMTVYLPTVLFDPWQTHTHTHAHSQLAKLAASHDNIHSPL